MERRRSYGLELASESSLFFFLQCQICTVQTETSDSYKFNMVLICQDVNKYAQKTAGPGLQHVPDPFWGETSATSHILECKIAAQNKTNIKAQRHYVNKYILLCLPLKVQDTQKTLL